MTKIEDKINQYFKLKNDIIVNSLGIDCLHYALVDERHSYYYLTDYFLNVADSLEKIKGEEFYYYELNDKTKIIEKDNLVFILAKEEDQYWYDASIFILNKNNMVEVED